MSRLRGVLVKANLDQPTSQDPFSMTSRPSAVIRPCARRIDDQIPVQRRSVDAARLGVALAECEMNGAPDLLVIKDATGKSINPRIQPKSQLT